MQGQNTIQGMSLTERQIEEIADGLRLAGFVFPDDNFGNDHIAMIAQVVTDVLATSA